MILADFHFCLFQSLWTFTLARILPLISLTSDCWCLNFLCIKQVIVHFWAIFIWTFFTYLFIFTSNWLLFPFPKTQKLTSAQHWSWSSIRITVVIIWTQSKKPIFYLKVFLFELICFQNILIFFWLDFFLFRLNLINFFTLNAIPKFTKACVKFSICLFTKLYLFILLKAWCGILTAFITNEILFWILISIQNKVKDFLIVFFQDFIIFWYETVLRTILLTKT